MIKCGFFNAIKNQSGSYDRAYNAEDINTYFKGAMSENGIFKFVGNQCTVKPYAGMNVLVSDGKGAIRFHWFENEIDEAVKITKSHPTLSRYTAIVARYDDSNRQIYLATIDGEYEEIPSKPEIVRTINIYDICLAYVYVEAGSSEITSENIQDTRENEELCGFIKTLLDSGGDSGISRVDHLPLPQESEIGKLYYLTIKDGENEPGFYTCKKTIIYGYKNVVSISGEIANRPDPSFEYANQVYFATDELKYYVCKKNEDNIYEWNEIEVIETSGLPTPSADTYDNYYLDTTDNTLHLGISEIGYVFAPFSGGGGNFAIIQISCPPNTKVRVSHNGEHHTNEVKDGIWLYGCIDAGEYLIAIPNTTITQTVSITYKGQIESIFIAPQVVNTDILYLLGDENVELSGGWNLSGTGGGGFGTVCYTYASNVFNINFDKYKKLFIKATHKGGYFTDHWGGNEATQRVSATSSLSIYSQATIFTLNNISYNANYAINNFFVCEAFTKNVLNFRIHQDPTKGPTSVPCQSVYYKNTNNLYLYARGAYSNNPSGDSPTLTIYAVLLIKDDDDLSGLSAYGSTINEILVNSVELMADTVAVNYMAINCTGEFMLTALNNATFKNAYNLSENKDILLANSEWSKFIPLMNL